MCFAYTTENIFSEISNISQRLLAFRSPLCCFVRKTDADEIVKKYRHKNNNFRKDMFEKISLPKNVYTVKSITFKPIDLMVVSEFL